MWYFGSGQTGAIFTGIKVAMAEFSWTGRLIKAALGPALFCVWWYFAPDYSRFLSTPLGQLTITDIAWRVGWLLLLVPWAYATISWFYEAWTGRDSVWLWHPD
jgi:hypothetical protein